MDIKCHHGRHKKHANRLKLGRNMKLKEVTPDVIFKNARGPEDYEKKINENSRANFSDACACTEAGIACVCHILG